MLPKLGRECCMFFYYYYVVLQWLLYMLDSRETCMYFKVNNHIWVNGSNSEIVESYVCFKICIIIEQSVIVTTYSCQF